MINRSAKYGDQNLANVYNKYIKNKEPMNQIINTAHQSNSHESKVVVNLGSIVFHCISI